MSSNCEDANDDTWMQHSLEHDIMQVDTVAMPDGQTWKGVEDHSKWVFIVLLCRVSLLLMTLVVRLPQLEDQRCVLVTSTACARRYTVVISYSLASKVIFDYFVGE